MGYIDQLNQAKGSDSGKSALKKMSPGEIGWNIAGAIGGGSLGYMLSKLIHNRPDAKTKLLYVLGGAGAGVGGVNYALAKMPGSDGFDGSKRDEMRLHGMTDGGTSVTDAEKKRIFEKPGIGTYGAAVAGGIYGASRGGFNPINPMDWGSSTNYKKLKGIKKLLNGGDASKEALETAINTKLRAGGIKGSSARRWAQANGFDFDWVPNSPMDVKLRYLRPRNAMRRGIGALTGAALLGLAAYGMKTGMNALGNPSDTAISKEKILGAFGKERALVNGGKR